MAAAAAAPAAGYGRGGWLRDLTREGVEANPGPKRCSDCGCQYSYEALTAPVGSRRGAQGLPIENDAAICTCGHPLRDHEEEGAGSGAAGPKLLPVVHDPFSVFWAALLVAVVTAIGGSAVGQLLSLPPNTFLFGLVQAGRHLYVRPCYPQLLGRINARFGAGTTKILVTGIPGVGKSYFAAYLLHHYAGVGATIVYEDAKRGARWLLASGTNRVQEGGMQDFKTELAQSPTIYVCDVGGVNSPEPAVCNARTIVLSSPDPAHYQEWLKAEDVTLYMPMWGADEVAAVVPAVYPQRFLADGTTPIYLGRLELHGGIARTIFHSATDAELEEKLMRRVKACDLVRLLQSIVAGERIKSLKLLQYVVDPSSNFEKASLDFASDEICERVMKEKEERGANEVVSFLTSAAGKPDVAGMRGKVFELWAHRVLAAGGDFRARWENDATHTDLYIHLSETVQKGIVNDLTILQPGEYARLLQSNYKTIDAARHPKHLFQMTVSQTHPVHLAGLNAAMTGLGLISTAAGGIVKPCTFYFVVPPDVFPVYKHSPGAMVPSGSSLPPNVALMVLMLPLDMPAASAAAVSSTGAAASAAASAAGGVKRKAADADTLLPPAKKVVTTTCNCTTGCQSGLCKCFKNGNKCTLACHTAAAAAASAACVNV